MREIRFRLFDNERKRMIQYPTLEETFEQYEGSFPRGHFELMQFTGLHDKDGKEIWEGDIIGIPTGKYYLVEWQDFGFVTKTKWCDKESVMPLIINDGNLEVLGNVHENPDLLTTPGKD